MADSILKDDTLYLLNGTAAEYRLYIDWERVAGMIFRASKAKTKRSRLGPLRVVVDRVYTEEAGLDKKIGGVGSNTAERSSSGGGHA